MSEETSSTFLEARPFSYAQTAPSILPVLDHQGLVGPCRCERIAAGDVTSVGEAKSGETGPRPVRRSHWLRLVWANLAEGELMSSTIDTSGSNRQPPSTNEHLRGAESLEVSVPWIITSP